jgi:hypothetical protein
MATKNPKSLLCQLLYQKLLGNISPEHNLGVTLWRRAKRLGTRTDSTNASLVDFEARP